MSRPNSPSLRAGLLVAGLFVLAACSEVGPSSLPLGVASSDGSFQDAFIPGQTGAWLLEKDDLGSTEINSEQLVVTVRPPNTMQFAALEEPTFSDFVLEVDARQRAGKPEASYGVLFRMVDGTQFYRFEITGNGSYIIERRDADGSWTRLIPEWKTSPAINQGLNVANRLKVIANGPELTFYANDILLEQITDSTYTTGRIALDAGTFGGGDLQVSFDDLSVSTSGS